MAEAIFRRGLDALYPDQMTDQMDIIILKKLIGLAETHQLNFNQLSKHGENLISYSWIAGLVGDTLQFIDINRDFDPNQKDYLTLARRYHQQQKEDIWLLVIDKLVQSGIRICEKDDLFGNFISLKIIIDPYGKFRYSEFKHPITNHFYWVPESDDLIDGRSCQVCHLDLESGEPYFLGPANCPCVIHFTCAFALASSLTEDLTNKNLLERRVPRCPGCGLCLTPSFVRSLRLQLFSNLNILSPTALYLPDTRELKHYQSKLKELAVIDSVVMNRLCYLIRFRSHPWCFPCTATENCDGFVLAAPADKFVAECPQCRLGFEVEGSGLSSIKMTAKEQEEILAIMIANSSTIRPCPNKNCGRPIEKLYGCDNMTCSFCTQQFNWLDAKQITADANQELARFF